MATQQDERREREAFERIRDYLTNLYGEEQMLIVRNMSGGVVSIGFGEYGDRGGRAIERSRLPIVLTDEFPRETWIKSADFRRAIAKGWLVPITKEEYEHCMAQYREDVARLQAIAEQAAESDSTVERPEQRLSPVEEPQVINEDTATLQPASMDERTKQFLEYEKFEHLSPPPPTAPANVTVIGGTVSSRVISFCEQVKSGSMTTAAAVQWLYDESKILTKDDLMYVLKNTTNSAIKKAAHVVLAEL